MLFPFTEHIQKLGNELFIKESNNLKFKNKMNNFIRKKDIENLEQKVHELLIEQRRTRSEISKRINGSTSQITAVIFSESRKIRQEIGYQTLMLKILEDNLSEIQFDEEAGTDNRNRNRDFFQDRSKYWSGDFRNWSKVGWILTLLKI